MTVSERIKDIAARTGLSELIVRTVIEAECESSAETLSRGETTTLLGRCIIKPAVGIKMVPTDEGMKEEEVVMLKTTPSKSLLNNVQKLYVADQFKTDEEREYEIPRLATMQIGGLV